MSLSISPPFFISISNGNGEPQEFIVEDEETIEAVKRHFMEVCKWHPWHVKVFVCNVDLYMRDKEEDGVFDCGRWVDALRMETAKLLANSG